MGIRDILMLVLGAACVPLALYDAYYGLLAYSWLSFMRPQSVVWSSEVQNARITFAVAAALLVRVLFTEGPKVRFRAPTVLFLGLWAWYGVAAWASKHPDLSLPIFYDFCKIGVAVALITGLVRTRSQLKWLIVLLALCPGFYAAKLGLFFVQGGEATHHGGPIGSDNNDTALFIAMSIPMLVFAVSEIRDRRARYGLYAAAALAVPGVIVTTSRGGMLAMVAAVALTLWRKTTWWKGALVAGAAAVAALAIVPAQTYERYETIGEYEADKSAMGRIQAWQTSIAMANDRPLVGVGFGMPAYLAEYNNYKKDEHDYPHVAHSVWFSVLGEAGYVGLGLYVALVVSSLWMARRVRRLAAGLGREGGTWARDYASMIECTIGTFAVGATFLSKVTFEFGYAVFVLVVPLLALVEKEVAATAAARQGEPHAAGAMAGGLLVRT